jgi:hypothetical protein
MVLEPLRPSRGGFLRPFGCGRFIRDFLMGKGPYDSLRIDPEVGAPQADICFQYKTALLKATALDRATRAEEKRARREKRSIDPENIERLAERHLARMPYKTRSCRYHSFVVYFSNLVRLGWVEKTGQQEASAFQDHYPQGEPRIYFQITPKGKSATDDQWDDPRKALYGS